MSNGQLDALVESLGPEWSPEAGAETQVVSTDEFKYILDTAYDSGEFFRARRPFFNGISIVDVIPRVTREEIDEANARFEAKGLHPLYSEPHTPQEIEVRRQEEYRMRADRIFRKLGRKLFDAVGIQTPELLQPSQEKIKRLQAKHQEWVETRHLKEDVILYRDSDQKIIFVADGSEKKFSPSSPVLQLR